MATDTFKSWMSANWYSLVALVLVGGTFIMSSQRTEWRVTRLEQDTTTLRTELTSTAVAVAEIKGSLAVITVRIGTIGEDVKDCKQTLANRTAK